jgi:hypothetical protein
MKQIEQQSKKPTKLVFVEFESKGKKLEEHGKAKCNHQFLHSARQESGCNTSTLSHTKNSQYINIIAIIQCLPHP